MNRWISAAAVVLAAGLAAGPAGAQQFGNIGSYSPPGGRRPALSPLLNLNRPGTNPAINYFALVRPQVDTARNLQTLQTELQALPVDPALGAAGPMMAPTGLVTGHPATFFNYGGYFNTLGGRGGVGAGPGGTPFGAGTLGGPTGTGVGVGVLRR